MFKGKPRAPHHRPRTIMKEVRDAILGLRDALTERYGGVADPKPILYHLHQDPRLKAKNTYLRYGSVSNLHYYVTTRELQTE